MAVGRHEKVGEPAFQPAKAGQPAAAGAGRPVQRADIVDVVADERSRGGFQIGQNDFAQLAVGHRLPVAHDLDDVRLGVDVQTVVALALAGDLHPVTAVLVEDTSGLEGTLDGLALVVAEGLAGGQDRRNRHLEAGAQHGLGQIVDRGGVGTEQHRLVGAQPFDVAGQHIIGHLRGGEPAVAQHQPLQVAQQRHAAQPLVGRKLEGGIGLAELPAGQLPPAEQPGPLLSFLRFGGPVVQPLAGGAAGGGLDELVLRDRVVAHVIRVVGYQDVFVHDG